MRTDVTVRAYAICAKAGGCSAAPQTRDEPMARCNWRHDRADHPMNCVTFGEATSFCVWVEARLPSREEWTFAAASADVERVTGRDSLRAYPWGADPVSARRANYCDAQCPKALGSDSTDGKNLARWEKAGLIDRSQDDGFAATSPVGRYPDGATRWGLLDMAGNVWQWTSTPGPAATYEVRGGSWDNAPASLRIGRILPWPAGSADAGMGFRCVQVWGD